jgi:8-oxo-dGTP pyrophosphatase MutT (NUDIX family)
MDTINTVVEAPTYIIAILYNEETVYMSKRIDPKKVMYNLYQVPGGKTKPMENGRQAACREIYEETGLTIVQKRFKFLTNDPEFNCDIYTVLLKLGETPIQTEPQNMGPWLPFTWEEFYVMAAQQETTPSLTKYRKEN